MRPIVDKLISKLYGEPDIIAMEVPTPTRCYIDVLYLFNSNPYIVAVELKISDWRTGFRQALTRKLYAKYSFLALQWKLHRNVNLRIFKEFGVGLIAVDGTTARIVLEPKESEFFKERKLKILNYIATALKKAEIVQVRRIPDWVKYPPLIYM